MYKLRFQGNTVTYGNLYVGCPDPAHLLLLNQTTGGTITADKMSGVPGEIATLSNTPDSYYTFDNYSITGATLTGSQFEFGDTDVTAEATFLPTVYNVTLQTDGHGAISANKTTGIYGDTITLSQTASAEYNFNSYQMTGAVLTGSQFSITGSDVTAKATYTQKVYTLTLQNDGHGTISASKTTGHKGDTVTLSNKYNTYYRFNNYTQTGGSISNNTFTFGSQNATAKANFKLNYFFASGRFAHIANPTASGNRSVKSDFYAYKTYTSGAASIPAGFYVTKTTYQSGNKIGNKTASTTNVWSPTGTISAYKWSGYCDTDAYQKAALSTNYLSTRSHHLVVGSTNFGSTGGTVNGTTKGATKLTNYGSTTTLGAVHCTAQLTTTKAYDYWMTNQAYTTANSIWWASGYIA